MKRIIFAVAAGFALIGSHGLLAGPERIDSKDSKMVTQPVVEKECTWTGFYIGGHGGYGWGSSSFLELDETDPPFNFHQEEGFFGGGQAGYNLQLGRFFVIGIEGEFSGTDFGDSTKVTIGNGEFTEAHFDSNWMGTIGARVGVSFWKNRLLAYAKGGAAFTHFDFHTLNAEEDERFDADDTQTVPLLGFGLEYALTCHWSVKAEYKHLFFDTEEVTGTENDGGIRTERRYRIDGIDRDLVEAGVNFKF